MGDRKGLVSSAGKLVPLKEIDVSVTISGYVADIQSTSLYVNNEESPIEAIFTFPLDDQSAVYRFEADIDGRHLIAECHEKEKAKEIYDDAVSFGHTAMLLQEDESAGDIFRCRLGNLPSNAEAKISTGFATELDLEADGKVKFTLPAILNPRYSPGVGGLNPTEKARYATADAIPYKLNFQLLVRGPRKIKGIQGSKDKLNVDYLEDQRVAKVTLAEEFKFDHDLSVLVEYESCSLPQIVFEKGDPHSGGLLKEDVLMINFFLEPPAQLSRTNPGEFIFILDRSGSMQGDKILNAKETLLLFLKSLPVNCYFNSNSPICGYCAECLSKSWHDITRRMPQQLTGQPTQSLKTNPPLSYQRDDIGSQKYNEENLRKAEELQKQMKADLGGTELLSPLEHVFKQKLIENYPRQLFVLTDGEISNTADVLKLAGTNSQHSRVFTVGIGEGASTALVRGLAKAGKGKEVFVTDSERLQPKVISLLQCAMQPVATDVEIVWELPSPVTWIMMPPKIPYLFLGVRQILYVMLSGTEGVDPSYVNSVTLKGKLVSKPFEYKETFTFHGNTEMGTFVPIHRLAAKAQVKDLQLNDAPKEQIITVSKSANVISKHTAFVMVDSEGKLVEGIPMQRIIPTSSMGRMINRRAVPLMTYSMKSSVKDASQMLYDMDRCLSAPSVLQSRSLKKMTKSCSPSSKVSDVMDYEESHERFYKRGMMAFEESEEMSDTERMMDVIRLQKFQGSWSLDKKLLGMLKTDAEILKQTIPLQDDSVVATVAVIAWLRKHHSERRDEWQMLETKALDWLERQGLHGHAVEDLISRLNI